MLIQGCFFLQISPSATVLIDSGNEEDVIATPRATYEGFNDVEGEKSKVNLNSSLSSSGPPQSVGDLHCFALISLFPTLKLHHADVRLSYQSKADHIHHSALRFEN